eukprot:TRINITY_DN9235_c0_g1_i3.p1 TRINITY_DN9235_c0_g1~~TRINITY_DN9235_c0_g1_i3.p1  ORF type:complete len:361 (-),score=48.63 TRINITY_DN9235_c0_g1_i3:101-1183(-)
MDYQQAAPADAPTLCLKVQTLDGNSIDVACPDFMLGEELWELLAAHEEIALASDQTLTVSTSTEALQLHRSLGDQGLQDGAVVFLVFSDITEARQKSMVAKLRKNDRINVEEWHVWRSISSLDKVHTLSRLDFSGQFSEICNLALPPGLRSLAFAGSFNESMVNVALPDGLISLTFGSSFQQSMEGVKLPADLQNLEFGQEYCRSMENVALPVGLLSLSHINRSLSSEKFALLTRLQSLTFGWSFNYSMENIVLPRTLKNLTFGHSFNQSMENVTLPAGLRSLTFGGDFNQSMDNVIFPEGLQRLVFGFDFGQSMENVTLPEGLQNLIFQNPRIDIPPRMSCLLCPPTPGEESSECQHVS